MQLKLIWKLYVFLHFLNLNFKPTFSLRFSARDVSLVYSLLIVYQSMSSLVSAAKRHLEKFSISYLSQKVT